MERITQEQDDVDEDMFDRSKQSDYGSRTGKRSREVCAAQAGVNVWRRLQMEYAPLTSATAQGVDQRSLEISSENSIRCE